MTVINKTISGIVLILLSFTALLPTASGENETGDGWLYSEVFG